MYLLEKRGIGHKHMQLLCEMFKPAFSFQEGNKLQHDLGFISVHLTTHTSEDFRDLTVCQVILIVSAL